MTFGNGGETGATRTAPAFDFGLAPSSQAGAGSGGHDRRRKRRGRSGPDRAALATVAIVIVLSIGVIGGAAFVAWTLVQNSEAQVAADTAPLCADLAATPGVLAQPGFGWPTESADIPTTVAAMQAFQQRWAQLASVAPPTLRADVAAVATIAATVISRVETSQSIDRTGNLATVQSVTSQTAIPAWVTKYCD